MKSYNEQMFKDALFDEYSKFTDLLKQKEILDATIEKSKHTLENIAENWKHMDEWKAGKVNA